MLKCLSFDSVTKRPWRTLNTRWATDGLGSPLGEVTFGFFVGLPQGTSTLVRRPLPSRVGFYGTSFVTPPRRAGGALFSRRVATNVSLSKLTSVLQSKEVTTISTSLPPSPPLKGGWRLEQLGRSSCPRAPYSYFWPSIVFAPGRTWAGSGIFAVHVPQIDPVGRKIRTGSGRSFGLFRSNVRVSLTEDSLWPGATVLQLRCQLNRSLLVDGGHHCPLSRQGLISVVRSTQADPSIIYHRHGFVGEPGLPCATLSWLPAFSLHSWKS